jgi:TonB-linked SusC/RagA family outer membrane protein
MNKFILMLVFGMLMYPSFAQIREIRGTVLDDAGLPLQGVTVTLSGSTVATQTNADGLFSIRVPVSGSHVLVMSFTGYLTKRVPVTGEQLTVSMEKNIVSADEVVVVGYQSVRRRDLTGSVSSVSARQIKDIPINSAAEALNGRLAGVTATTAEGSPDAEVTIRVRGGMSITGDNKPLYIVDGIQVENALSTISPQDIQSIDVLKDASATAIYGARGGNGVIIITTKSGRPGKPTITYNGFAGIKKLSKKLNVLSPYDFVVYQSERSRGSTTDSTTFTKYFGTTWDTLNVYKNVDVIDWQNEVMGRTGFTQTHNLSLQGGNEKITYNFGYTYNNERAIVINSEYKRHLINFKTEYKPVKNLKLGLTTRYNNQNVLGAGVSSDQGTAYNRLRNTIKYRPFLSPDQSLDEEDPFADPNVGNSLTLENPILLAGAEYRKKTTNGFNITAYGDYRILKNLSFRSTFGFNQNNNVNRQFFDSITPYSKISGGRLPIARLDTVEATTYTNSNVFTYSLKKLGGRHDLDFVLGEETYDLRTTTRASLFMKFPQNTPHETAFEHTELGTPFAGYPQLGKTRYTSLSFFGRVNYGLSDKYLFSFNLRADGASKFGPGNRWGYFPGGSFAWRVKEESFLKNSEFISDLKLRVGYGAIGNNRIADYLYLTSFKNDGSYYYGFNNEVILASYPGSLVNPNLKWESTVNENIGLDISFQKRVDISLDYYFNNSNDLLLNVPIASTYGYATQIQNIGKTSNQGFEAQVNAVIVRNREFGWNANFNISTNKNKIVALGPDQDYFYPAASWGVSGQPTDYIQKVGHPVGSIYGLVNDGFYKVSDFDYDASTGIYTLKAGVVSNAGVIGVVGPGSVKFKDLNNDGIIDMDHDRQIIGNPAPKFTGGLNQQFTYKRWDASLFVNFSYGNDIYNANKIEFTNGYTPLSNMLDLMKGRWKVVTADGQTAQWISNNKVYGIPPDELAALNANATIWQPIRANGAFYPSSWAIEDGSFLRLNNLTIGYSIPAENLRRAGVKNLRFYLTGNNLAVWTKYSGFDPEVNVRNNPLTPGLDYSAYPKSRSFIFGVNVTF